MWRGIISASVMVVMTTGEGVAATELTLASAGTSDYQIIVPDTAPSPAIAEGLTQTARLMQAAFAANGAELPIVAEAERDPAMPGIHLGDTAFARGNGIDVTQLKGWSYAHRVVGRDVIVVGRDESAPAEPKAAARRPKWNRFGTAKAAADFLRLYAGVRFLYPDLHPRMPVGGAAKVAFQASPAFEFLDTPTITVPADLDTVTMSFIEYNVAYPPRGSFYDIANNRFPLVDTVFGGHTYHRACPPKEYGATDPECFALIGGKRLTDGAGQYCVSNPKFRELLYQDLVRWLDSGYSTVDLGQPDGFRACQCDDCRELFDTGDDWSEKLWNLHRNLAARVLESHPDKTVSIMSYILTATPPKTFREFPANVRIMLCGTNEEDIAVWRDHVVPRGFTGYLYNWCPNLSTRYTPMRTPGYIETQARRLHRNNINAIKRDGPGALYGLEGPVYYAMGRMFDDAEHNQVKDLVHEFCGAAFGTSAGDMLRFYDRLYHGIELYAEYLGTRCPGWSYGDIYGRRHKYLSDPFQLLGFLYTPSLLATLEKDLAHAEKKANNDKVRTRLALVRREFDYLTDLATVIHLYHAYEIRPDLASRDRLLDAIDARNTRIDRMYSDPPLAGWTYVTFPPPGHSAAHLRLVYDRYQEPFKNTCLNWDTKAMRAAPLPGTACLTVQPITGPVTLDSPAWDSTTAAALNPLPATAELTRKTTLRVLADDAAVYLRLECELPAALMADLAAGEQVEVCLAPPSGQDNSYRFSVGIQPDSRAAAACGFVTDVMDPRYGQFDPDWNGDWAAETRLEPEANRWLAMLRIPFQTLGVEPPTEGTLWRGNVGRTHVAAPNRVEHAIWSATPNTTVTDDRGAFGEIAFENAAAEPEKNPLQAWREEYNKGTSGAPAEWQALPQPLPDPFGTWLIRTDPLERGEKDGWFRADTPLVDWQPVRVPAFWAETEGVGSYQGYAWYRTTFTVPTEWGRTTVRLRFAGVDEQAWVYVNGQLVKEHSEKSEGKTINDLWEEPFAADVPPAGIRYGAPNTLVVRVRNAIANGGIWRPVLGHALPAK